MAKWGSADFKELQALQERLNSLEARAGLQTFCEECSKELAARLLALVIPRTPVGKRPKINGAKTARVTGASGRKGTFLTAEGARYEQYWAGYVGGTLRRGWTGGKSAGAKAFAESLIVEKNGDAYTITVENPVEYASYVEFGHRQEPGRYVPALGKSLKAGWVKGRYMLTISEEELQKLAPGLLQQKLKAFLLKEVFGDGGN